MNEEQLNAKLEQIGLPIYGTHEQKLERARLNGLVEIEVKKSDESVVSDAPRRGRPPREKVAE